MRERADVEIRRSDPGDYSEDHQPVLPAFWTLVEIKAYNPGDSFFVGFRYPDDHLVFVLQNDGHKPGAV